MLLRVYKEPGTELGGNAKPGYKGPSERVQSLMNGTISIGKGSQGLATIINIMTCFSN